MAIANPTPKMMNEIPTWVRLNGSNSLFVTLWWNHSLLGVRYLEKEKKEFLAEKFILKLGNAS